MDPMRWCWWWYDINNICIHRAQHIMKAHIISLFSPLILRENDFNCTEKIIFLPVLLLIFSWTFFFSLVVVHLFEYISWCVSTENYSVCIQIRDRHHKFVWMFLLFSLLVFLFIFLKKFMMFVCIMHNFNDGMAYDGNSHSMIASSQRENPSINFHIKQMRLNERYCAGYDEKCIHYSLKMQMTNSIHCDLV